MNKKLAKLPLALCLLLLLSLFTPGLQGNLNAETKEQTLADLPIEVGEKENLGPAALAAKAQGVAIGENEVYYAINGNPARFYAADAKTGEVIYTESLPGSDVVWGMTVGADGNVYFAGTNDGILYRYNVVEETLDKVGKNPSDKWVWQLKSTDDGKIYGATYPRAKVFEYDIETETFVDLGTFKEGQQYARGIGVTDKNLYVGIGTIASLHKMDRETKEVTEIELPITGEETSVSNVWEMGDNLFVAYGTSLLTIDVNTGEVLKEMNWEDLHTFDGLISSRSPHDNNLIYYRDKQSGELWTYHLETHDIQAVEPRIQLPASAVKSFEWIKDDNGTEVLAILHHQLEYSIYNPITKSLTVSYPEAEMQGLTIQSLEIGPDNNVYMGGYQGSFGVFDIDKEEYILRERDPHQIEGMGFLNGDVYLGTYGGSRIYKYDPEQDFEYNNGVPWDNPEMVYQIKDDQSRPFTFEAGENKLFIGTIPDYGKLGGSLTIYDAQTDEWTSTRNVIENQSIIGLAYHDGILYGGSSTAGGLGVAASEERAKMFAYDLSTEEYSIFDLDVKGLKAPKMIGELSIGPDNNLWGVAYGINDNGENNSVVFAMDPETKEILKSTELYTGVAGGSSWRPFYLRWDDSGYLYTTAGRYLTVIDPDTMASKQLIEEKVDLMDLDANGDIYYASGANLHKLSTNLIDDEEIEKLNIALINEIEDVIVDFGTSIDELKLPETVDVTLSDDSIVNIPVNWDIGQPEFDPHTSGTYTFTGSLDISNLDNIGNSNELVATLNVFVKEEITDEEETEEEPKDLIIEDITSLKDLVVDQETKIEDLDLPTHVELILSDASSISVPVIWENSEPLFDGNKSGTYVFTGTLDLSKRPNVLNPSGLTATLNVIVKEIESDEEKPVVPSKPSDNSDSDKNDEVGSKLPSTATSIFNIMLIGLVLIVIGSGVIFRRRKLKA